MYSAAMCYLLREVDGEAMEETQLEPGQANGTGPLTVPFECHCICSGAGKNIKT